MKANTPQFKAKHNPVFKYSMRVRKPMTYGNAGTVGTIKIQTSESDKIDPDTGLGEPQPQTSAKATLRLDEAGRSQLTLVIGKFTNVDNVPLKTSKKELWSSGGNGKNNIPSRFYECFKLIGNIIYTRHVA